MARFPFVAAQLGTLAVGLHTEAVTCTGRANQRDNEIRVNVLRQDKGNVLVAVQQHKTEEAERAQQRSNLLLVDASDGSLVVRRQRVDTVPINRQAELPRQTRRCVLELTRLTPKWASSPLVLFRQIQEGRCRFI
ncbi:MAG: hypothetical protein OXH19_14135 [Chloroflexi bacterium]|nr:hypothetical protein [Chloroflexota bacterium]MCY3589965.1 hypothetical protein [Chloroflexota bacterium]MCY3684594.1 hypothetical protein [Chloroflexota bacterium]MDE2710010.1 hypothetical protein [Chloroflexota bacterium]